MQDQETSAVRIEEEQLERLALLDLAILLYTQQGRSCSLEQGISLLRTLQPLLTAGPGMPPGSALERQRPEHLVCLSLLDGVVTTGPMQSVEGQHDLGRESFRA